MKRLSATQKLIEGLVPQVPALSASQKDWAIRNVNYFAVRREFLHCPCCAHTIDTAQAEKVKTKWCSSDTTIVCPHCGAKIQLRTPYNGNEKQRHHQDDFFQIMNVVGDWQVTRLIYMERYCYTRKPSTDWEFYEVCQAWNRPDEDTTYFRALSKKVWASNYFNPYSLRDYRALKDENGNYLQDEKGYYLYETIPRALEPRKAGGANYFETSMICPNAQVLPQYKKMGLDATAIRKLSSAHNAMCLMEAFSPKNYKPMYETLIKAKAYKVFGRVTDLLYRNKADAYFSAWKIATRNGYNYKRDMDEWFDCIDLLCQLGMDYRNPHYVCPKDLHAMHQHLLKLSDRKRELEELKRKENEDKELRKRVAKYLDMEIRNKHFDIIVLPNVKAFKDEGDHMGHCVYSCSYYAKPNSLILSARDKKGHRVETIEVYLDKLTIHQCYGYGDKHTKWHKEIMDLMNENMWQVKERRDAKRMRRAS